MRGGALFKGKEGRGDFRKNSFLKGKEGRVGFRKITGATAPPIIVMMSREEANLVFVPTSLNARMKLVANLFMIF